MEIEKYQIHYLEEVVKQDIPALDQRMKKTIKRAIEERLMIDPIGFGKPLQHSLRGHRRFRISDYRVIFRIEKESVIVIAIKHRKEVYES